MECMRGNRRIMTDKEAQILSILTLDIPGYVLRRTGKKSSSTSDLKRLYNVTRKDIDEYVEKMGFPKIHAKRGLRKETACTG